MPKFEQGGLLEVGGRRHSQGGTRFVGEDGTRFEAERGEIIGVMNRTAAAHFLSFNNVYAKGNARNNVFASGGIVERNLTTVTNLPPSINEDALAQKITEGLIAALERIPPNTLVYSEFLNATSKFAKPVNYGE